MKPPGAFVCGLCGKPHEGPPDLAFERPDAILALSKARRRRCFENGDACVIVPPLRAVGRRRFFLRCTLRVPLTDRPGEEFAWGPWAQVARADFERTLKLWDSDASGEPPFAGRLANALPGVPQSLGVPLIVQLGTPADRPTLFVTSADHAIARMQSRGVTAHEACELAGVIG